MSNYNINDFYPRTGQEIKDDGTVINEANGINPDGSRNVKTLGRNQTTIQAFNNTTIGANGSNSSPYYDCNGFDRVGITCKAESSSSFTLTLEWSVDNTTTYYYESIGTGVSSTKGTDTGVKARYVRVTIQNTDTTNPHTYYSGLLLKA